MGRGRLGSTLDYLVVLRDTTLICGATQDFWRRAIDFRRIGTMWYGVILLTVPALVLMTWVFNNNRRSTWSARRIHFMVNVIEELFSLTLRAGAFHILLWIIVAIGVMVPWGPERLAHDRGGDSPNADPDLQELAGAGDGVDVSNEGDTVITDLLRERGYAPINLVTNAETLASVWHRTTPNSSGGEEYRQYTADGTYRMGRSPEELAAQPRVEGEFWFEGDQMVMRDVTALPSYDPCLKAGQARRHTVERLANGASVS